MFSMVLDGPGGGQKREHWAGNGLRDRGWGQDQGGAGQAGWVGVGG